MNDPQDRRPAPGRYDVRGAREWHPIQVLRADPEVIDVRFGAETLRVDYTQWSRLTLCGDILSA